MNSERSIMALDKALLDFDCSKIQGVELLKVFDEQFAKDYAEELEQEREEVYEHVHTQLALYTPDPSEQGGCYIGDKELNLVVRKAIGALQISEST